MYSLKEIRDFQELESIKIHKLASQIHPKLLRHLSFNDIMDDNFDASKYEQEYRSKIHNLIYDYNKTVRSMLGEHLYYFIQGWAFVHPDSRWAIKKSDGTICTDPDWLVLDNFDDYIFDIEIEEYCNLVHEMLSDYNLKPFWEYSFTLYGNGYRKHINRSHSATNYIKYARSSFSGYKSNYEMLEQMAIDSTSIPYKMILPPMNNDVAAALRNDELQTSIKHHRVLYNFLENYGKDAKEGIYYSSDNDGKMKFRRHDL